MASSSRAQLARSLRSWRRPLSSYSAVYSCVNERCHMDALKKFQWRGNKERVNPESKDWAPVLSFAAAGLITWYSTSSMEQTISMCLQETKDDQMEVQSDSKKPKVVFVLGGPGSGKGTQCGKIVDAYGFTHLSAGDLLRAEINSGSKDGIMIQNMIKDGKIVPSEVTVKLLQKAMRESGNNKFLIDGFPRNEENRAAFESITGIEPEMVIFFDCPEQEMEKRLLNRNQGRIDDNAETIRKRFKVFVESTLPVVQQYEYRGKVHKINATRPIDEVFENVKPLFVPFVKEDLLQATKDIIKAIDSGDYGTYKQLCDPALTAFEPEAQGHLIEGLAFHKLYFDQCKEGLTFTQSGISCPHITLLDDNIGLVAYTRVYQRISHRGVKVETTNETRVWQRRKIGTGKYVWKLMHFHRSKNPSSHSS